MRSLGCRDEVDAMFTETLERSQSENSYRKFSESLNYIFHNLEIQKEDLVSIGSSEIGDSELDKSFLETVLSNPNESLGSVATPEMISEWNLIGERLCRVINYRDLNPLEDSKKNLKAFKIAKRSISKYKENYFPYIHNKYKGKLDKEFENYIRISSNSIELNKRLSLACLNFSKRVETSKKSKKRLKNSRHLEVLNKHIEDLSSHVVGFVFGREFQRLSIIQLIVLIDDLCNPDFLINLYKFPIEPKDKKDFDSMSVKFNENIEILRSQSRYLKHVLNLNDTYIENQLDPNSAEGKAIRRLEKISDDEMVTLVEQGQEIDVDGALERLKKRGYKVEI